MCFLCVLLKHPVPNFMLRTKWLKNFSETLQTLVQEHNRPLDIRHGRLHNRRQFPEAPGTTADILKTNKR
jgi:hypothetical protein